MLFAFKYVSKLNWSVLNSYKTATLKYLIIRSSQHVIQTTMELILDILYIIQNTTFSSPDTLKLHTSTCVPKYIMLSLLVYKLEIWNSEAIPTSHCNTLEHIIDFLHNIFPCASYSTSFLF